MLGDSIVGIQGKNGFVGCGFAIASRYVLTCAHVVNAALGNNCQTLPSEIVTLCFPYLGGTLIRARVVYWKPAIHDPQQLPAVNLDIEEDIAGLELLDEILGVKAVQCQPSLENTQFKAIGYPGKVLQGAIAQGKIQAKLPLGWFQIDGTCSQGFWAAPGYSGTAIRDLYNDQNVYGMMVAARKDEDKRIAYMIPSEKLTPAISHLKLLEILSQIELTPELWKRYKSVYQQCCPQCWDQPFPNTLSEMLMQLSNMEDSQYKLEFVARLLAQEDFKILEIQRRDLRQWGTQQMPNDAFLELIDRFRQMSVQSAIAVKETCLIVEVFPNSPPYTSRAFLIREAGTYDRKDATTYQEVFCWDFESRREIEIASFGETNSQAEIETALKTRLAGYIATCEAHYEVEATFRLELILPQSLMNLPIERWELECNPYTTTIPASAFPVVIRSHERTTQQYDKALGKKWRDHWNRLQSCREASALTGLVPVKAKDKPVQLEAQLKANAQTVGFKLCEVLQQSDQDKFLAALLGSAAPVAIWLRQAHGSETVTQILDQEVLRQCSIGQLPSQALQCRAEAIAQAIEPDDQVFKVGHHLSLLWENPNLLPPISTKHLSE